jgi:hypothetical protein
MKITSDKDNLYISLTVPRTKKGTYTYGDGEWTAPAACIFIDDHTEEYGLFHTQYLDYKDSLQATAPIAYFDSKEEALSAAEEFGLSVEYAHVDEQFTEVLESARKNEGEEVISKPCICGNRGYSKLMSNEHFEGCPCNLTKPKREKKVGDNISIPSKM